LLRTQKGSLGFYTKYLSEKAGNVKIWFKIVASLCVRGNGTGSLQTCSTGATAGEATKAWAVTALAYSFCTNTSTISSHNQINRFQHVLAGFIFDGITSLCPHRHQQNSEQWVQPALNITESVPTQDKTSELQLPILFPPPPVTMCPAKHSNNTVLYLQKAAC